MKRLILTALAVVAIALQAAAAKIDSLEFRSARDFRIVGKGFTDTESFYYPTLMALIFNGETAGRVRLARKSSLRDGVFDCLFLRKRNAFLSAMNMLLYLIGIKPRAVKFLRTKSLTLVTPTEEDTDVDGQNGGHFPLRVTCLAGELNIVCPKK